MKKNSCTPINPKKYSSYGLIKIHTRNLITKKNSCSSKTPLPAPDNFSNGPSLSWALSFWPDHVKRLPSSVKLSVHHVLTCAVCKNSRRQFCVVKYLKRKIVTVQKIFQRWFISMVLPRDFIQWKLMKCQSATLLEYAFPNCPNVCCEVMAYWLFIDYYC